MNGKAGLTVPPQPSACRDLTHITENQHRLLRTRGWPAYMWGDRYNFQATLILTRHFTAAGIMTWCYLKIRYKDPVIGTSPFI